MLHLSFNKILLSKLALLIGISSMYGLPSNAQTNRSDSDLLRNIQIGQDKDWNFPSETESISVQDDLQELGEYSISEPEPELVEREEKWGNAGDKEPHSAEFKIYGH